jgi:hypothetical protein
MSEDRPAAKDPAPPPAPAPARREPAGHEPAPPASPEHVRDRLRVIAERLREVAADLGGEVMIEIPSRLGDHEGLLLALANELEQLVK